MNTPSPAASMLYSGQWRCTEPANPSSGTAGMAAGRDCAGSAPTLDASTGAASRLVVLGIPIRFPGCTDVTATAARFREIFLGTFAASVESHSARVIYCEE